MSKFDRSSEVRVPGCGPGDMGSSPVGQPTLSFWEKLRSGVWYARARKSGYWSFSLNEGGYWAEVGAKGRWFGIQFFFAILGQRRFCWTGEKFETWKGHRRAS